MFIPTEKAFATELRERGHYLDDVYQVTMAYASSLWTRLRECERRVDAIESAFLKAHPDVSDASWFLENNEECETIGYEVIDVEDELEKLWDMVLHFEQNGSPFK